MSSCSNTKTVTVPQPVYITPPSVLTESVPCPAFSGKTNGDLIEYVIELRGVVGALNLRLAALKEYFAKFEKTVDKEKK